MAETKFRAATGFVDHCYLIVAIVCLAQSGDYQGMSDRVFV